MTDYRIVFHNGIMWAKVNGEIDRAPVHLGDRIIVPGEVLTMIGTKPRTSFNPGEPFKYIGKIDDNLLLFHFLSDKDEGPFYPSLYLIDALTLISFNPANGSACDVRV